MTDDLVKRLRLEAAHDMEWANNPEILVGQAADRIEELEAENVRLRELLSGFYASQDIEDALR
jgi:hypothetical protein